MSFIKTSKSMAAEMLGLWEDENLPPVVSDVLDVLDGYVKTVRGEDYGIRSSQIVALVVLLYQLGILEDVGIKYLIGVSLPKKG